jgi:hypothetical protein
MAGYTQADAQTMLDAWLAAEVKVASGQEYSIGSRRLRRADLAEIGERITFWRAEVERLANGGGVVIRGVYPG